MYAWVQTLGETVWHKQMHKHFYRLAWGWLVNPVSEAAMGGIPGLGRSICWQPQCVWAYEWVHFIKHIPLCSSKWKNSLFSWFWFVLSFSLNIVIVQRKLIIAFIKRQSLRPQLEQRVNGTLPEWVHFGHNPIQSCSSHCCATGEPARHI